MTARRVRGSLERSCSVPHHKLRCPTYKMLSNQSFNIGDRRYIGDLCDVDRLDTKDLLRSEQDVERCDGIHAKIGTQLGFGNDPVPFDLQLDGENVP
jgi:hypothetical protein